ncbi:MAG: carboxypeptidase regulatory-like domain-containing protein [Acidobacteriia bacterium]|nr:carboxypeptidase regulatory-like domain-containing protein [Terriglobia bacterium]
MDATGAVVPAARLVLTSTETGEQRNQSADPEGRFAFQQLKIGAYELRATAAGFRDTLAAAQVISGETSVLTLELSVGQITSAVSVTAPANTVDSASAQIQFALGAQEVAVLPVLRNPVLFTLTAPGIAPVTNNNPFLTTSSYNSNGSRGRANNVTIDSITSTDVVTSGNGGTQMGPLNFEQIQEVQLITNNFNAEFGRNSGSQLQFITKSGTNELHGSAYEFVRNSLFNARDFFDTTGHPSVTRQNEFGFAVGGPIRRNKTHFFATFAENPIRGLGTARIALVPTSAMIQQVTDPTSQKLLQLYQLPTSSSGSLVQSGPNWQNAYQFSARVDHQLSSRDSLTGRYALFNQDGTNPSTTFSTSSLAGFGGNFVNRPQNLNLTETHLLSTSLVNEFRFGLGRVSPVFVSQFAPPAPFIQITSGEVSPFGESPLYPQGRVENTFQYGDSLSWVKGAHNVKIGADAFRYQVNSFSNTNVLGAYRFSSWANFAAGIPLLYSQSFGTTYRGDRVTNSAFYVQDDWRIRRNLTVNLGVRAEAAGGVSEVNGLISNLNLSCTSPIGAAGTGPLGCFTTDQPSNRSHVNWAPRVGFAWSLGAQAHTVIRAGYGIAYDFLFLNPILNQRSLPPFTYSGSLSGGSSFAGTNSFASLVAGTAAFQAGGMASVGVFNPTALNFGTLNPVIDTALRNPRTQQWSFGIERDLGLGIVLKASYVGSKSDFLQRTRPINMIANPPAPATSLADETARLSAFKSAVAAGSGSALAPSDRFDPRFNDVNLLDSSANSNYHSFQFLGQRSFAHGYFLQVAYTFSKSIDDVSDAQGVLINDSSNQQNPLNNRDNRAVSEFDIPQRLAVTHVWELPFGKNLHSAWMRRLATGWAFSGISSWRSGFPVTFDAGPRLGIQPIALTGVSGGVMRVNAAGPFSFNPEPAGSAGAPAGLNTGTVPFSAYAAGLGLSQPLLGNYGTLGRNAQRLNAAPDFDWSVLKNTSITEHLKLELRGEFYNIFNNVVFQNVNQTIISSAFGQYTSVAFNSRNVQLGARFVF